MGSAGRVRTEQSADYEQPEVVRQDEDDAGDARDKHVDHRPRSGAEGPTGEHHDDGKDESASEGGTEYDPDLSIGDTDVREVDDGKYRHQRPCGITDEAASVEQVWVEGRTAGGGYGS